MIFRTFNEAMRERYGGKVYRIALSASVSCPNRDGTVGTGGCIFCSEGGSGEYAEKPGDGSESEGLQGHVREHVREPDTGRGCADGCVQNGNDRTDTVRPASCADAEIKAAVDGQIDRAIARIASKAGKEPAGYIAYYQAYTGTYGDLEYLEKVYTQAASRDDILALSIGTRPDCLGDDVLAMIGRLARIKPVWIELGLQTSRDDTGRLINRGYDTAVYDEAVRKLKRLSREISEEISAPVDIPPVEVITHMIVGLPGEDDADAVETARHIAAAGSDGIKISLLYVLKGTELGRRYFEDKSIIKEYNLEEYTDLLIRILQDLPDDMTVHRITGDAPKSLLIEPAWTADKKKVLNYMTKALREA